MTAADCTGYEGPLHARVGDAKVGLPLHPDFVAYLDGRITVRIEDGTVIQIPRDFRERVEAAFEVEEPVLAAIRRSGAGSRELGAMLQVSHFTANHLARQADAAYLATARRLLLAGTAARDVDQAADEEQAA